MTGMWMGEVFKEVAGSKYGMLTLVSGGVESWGQ